MTLELIRSVEQTQLKKDLPKLSVGDTVDVQVRIIEGAKERVQTFNGVIIRLQGTGITQSITVRRIVANEGVERIFRIHSPKVIGIEVKRHGHVRRAKLYYLRERVGKQRRLRDRRRGLEVVLPAEQPEPSLAPESATQSTPEIAAVQPPPAQA